MAKFEFDPEAMKRWSNEVITLLNGGSSSIKGCSIAFNGLMEKLTQPNVWTGAAAAQNFINFTQAHKTLINFTNGFGAAFAEEMKNLALSIENLELQNLGRDTDISNVFGKLDFEALTAASEANINKSYVVYDYALIDGIGRDLRGVKNELEEVTNLMINKLREIGEGRHIWEGNAAENARENLINVINTNLPKINEALNVCINNINAAALAAQGLDSGNPSI